MKRKLVYISYSHKDKYWHYRLRSVLDRDKRVSELVWDDSKLISGFSYDKQINEHLSQARIVVMLVSPDYLADDSGATDYEFAPAIEAYQNEQIPILWVPVRDSKWRDSRLREIYSATGDVLPLESLDEERQRSALEKVYRSILWHLELEERRFDVFLCHNSKDKEAVKEIGQQLKDRWLRPWLDEWELQPGMLLQRALEQQIETIGAAAVFFGPHGAGPWQDLEQEAFLREFVQRKCPVIPVIMPGVEGTPELPKFLGGLLWVDFRKKAPDPLGQLIWGITGERPVAPPAQVTIRPTHLLDANTSRQRPAMGGDSVSHYRGSAATLGCLVQGKKSRRDIYVLGDLLALWDADARKGDAIVQPGRADGGERVNDMIATLSNWQTVQHSPDAAAKNVSAAIAKVLDLDAVSPEIRGIGMIKGIAEAERGASVKMRGRNGVKEGRIVQLNAHDRIHGFPYAAIEKGKVFSSGGGSAGFSIPFGELILTTHMVEPGDSGAILLDEHGWALGMAVGGSEFESLFVPIRRVLDALSVTLVTEWPPASPVKSS